MDVPKNYPLSKDIIDRRIGQKPTLSEKARDLSIKVKTDWNDMKQASANRGKGEPLPVPKSIPSYKKGGKIKKTGLAYVHKGERVIPKNKVGKVKIMRKKG